MDFANIKSNKVYALVDCDSFFASCEVLRHPYWQWKAVCVWGDIIVASTYEAKAKWIKTWTPIWEARRILGRAWIFVKPDLYFYQQISSRLMYFLAKFSNNIEIFSIDEAFIDITWINEYYKKTYEQFIIYLKIEVKKNIWIPVSIWASKTKILSKMFTKINKPFWTFCAIGTHEIDKALEKIEVGDIPFIWKQSEKKINIYASNALSYKNLDYKTVQYVLKWWGFKIWLELNEINVFNFYDNWLPKWISRTRSFNPYFTNDKKKLFEYLIYNFERAFRQLIDLNMRVKKLSIFLRKKDFIVDFWEYLFKDELDNRKVLLNVVENLFNKIYSKWVLYRSTWVIFSNLIEIKSEQLNLFDYQQGDRIKKLSLVVNDINKKFWRFILVSANSIKPKAHIMHIKGLIWNTN